MAKIIRAIILLMCFSTLIWAERSEDVWYQTNQSKHVVLTVELFLSSTCPHCHKLDAFFNELAPKTSWLHVKRHYINQDKNALMRFNALLSAQKTDDFAVPSVFFCGSRWVGFSSAETTGKDLLNALSYCQSRLEKQGVLTETTVNVLKHWANANWLSTSIIEKPSPLAYTIGMALLDAISPCALFVFLGFLMFLFLQDTQSKRFVIGLLYVFILGGMHCVQQTNATLFFEWAAFMRWPALLTGVLAAYVIFCDYKNRPVVTLSLVCVALVAFMLQLHQQTCVTNWSYVFQQWLLNEDMARGQLMAYQLLYQTMYLVPLLLVLLLYAMLMRSRRFSGYVACLHRVGLIWLGVIAFLLMAHPASFSQFSLSLMMVLMAVIWGWFLRLQRGKNQ